MPGAGPFTSYQEESEFVNTPKLLLDWPFNVSNKQRESIREETFFLRFKPLKG